LGDWSNCEAAPFGGAAIYLGMVKEGVLELSREDAEYMNTGFPQKLALMIPQRAGMKFSGRMDELHKVNLGLLVGNITTQSSRYIYPGTQCAYDATYFTFWARRRRCDGAVLEAKFFKSLASGMVQIGSGNDAGVAGTPFEVNALDDSNGDFGGTTSAPLGWLYAPDAAV
jgi:hypothetical protein